MKTNKRDRSPAVVSAKTKQAGEARPCDWEWVERAVWTDRMLEALEKGVKGGVWFLRWPNKYFRDLGYFSLFDAHRSLLQSSRG